MSKRGQSWDGFEWYLSGNMCKIGEQKWENKNGLPTVATVSSLPWVKTTTRCLFVLSLGRFWVFFAISAMSSVCGVNTRPVLGEYVKSNEGIIWRPISEEFIKNHKCD